MVDTKTNYTGNAYAFFNCNASRSEIEAELPTIRHLTRAPKDLELTLTEGVENLKGDKKLKELAMEAKSQGIKYVLEAKYSGANNQEAAKELSGIMNQAYQSPLYQEGEQFSGAIVYKKRSDYKFLE